MAQDGTASRAGNTPFDALMLYRPEKTSMILRVPRLRMQMCGSSSRTAGLTQWPSPVGPQDFV